ncbi:MAG TPA: glutamine amidotransferase [Clostridiales bacterium]|nr:glutamine amidotransferase [Clostridiales bacterium]
MEALRICHLYPDLLNLYGDRGNLLSLCQRLKWRGLPYQLTRISLGEDFDPEAFDLVFLGGGQDYEQALLQEDLLIKKGSAIKEAVLQDVVFLCICGGYQMMGKAYITAEGRRIECLGAIDVITQAGKKRMIGNLVFKPQLDTLPTWLAAGFENHSGRTWPGSGVKPLGRVVKGFGNNGKDGTEGAIYRNVFCSYSHGSLLPKNPRLADELLFRAFARMRPSFKRQDLSPLADVFEEKAGTSILSLLHIRPDG